MDDKNKIFAEYKELNLPEINQKILQYWEIKDVFHHSVKIREGSPSFVFYEGPPSANGMPGIHHVIARSIKDIFCRYKTMKGYQVKRKGGWDTHGLPVELGVEKDLNITKEDIGQKISIEDYNSSCRQAVMKYTKEWEDLTRKMGYWIDMDNPYITYENQYIETLWWLLKELYTKGLLYKGYTIQPYSPAAGTGLSTHELNQPGCYRDTKDTTCTAQFKIINPLKEMLGFGDAFFLAWTTTPWTLPSNTALCVGTDIEYVGVQSYNPYTGKPITVIIAKDLLLTHFNEKASDIPLEKYHYGDKLIPFKIVGSWKGATLVGMEYEQLIPWINPGERAFRIIAGDFVSTEEGTGIVHIAPTFGADDYKIAKINTIPSLMVIDKEGIQHPMVDSTGKFFHLEDLDKNFVEKNINVSLYSEFAGRFVKNAYNDSLTNIDSTLDVDICVMLKQQNRVFKIEKHIHSYPHCWRTDKPIIYYPLDSWFIRTTIVKDRMIELNNTINWKPQSTGQGRFGKWLENLQDWNLSRSRYWGTPLPIWCTDDGTEEKCIGSIKELMEEIQKAIDAGIMEENPYQNSENFDLHRPYIDKIVLVSKSGKPMRRETDLIDVWFDSGAMPYAQLHYPFDNTELIDKEKFFPADFISEGVDQTRGWFFTLHAISVMTKNSIAFRNVISSGLVLDKNGNKMSKRLGNAVDPFEIIARYGADPLRWYMITNAAPWDNLKFDTDGIEEVCRKFFGTLYNTYSFFALYANVDDFNCKESEIPMQERPEIDRWILSVLHSLIKEVDEQLSAYEPTRAARAINNFVNDNLSNWYVRLNRKRFWGGKMDRDKLSAYQTLHLCLKTVSQLMSPIAPFYADKLYIDLLQVPRNTSVHLSDFPTYEKSLIDKELEEKMQIAQDISSMVFSLRRKVNIKVRQPLSSIMIPIWDNRQKEAITAIQALILNEVNVKEIKYVDNTTGILIKKIKPDFKKLGPRYGKIMKDLAISIAKISQEDILQLEQNGKIAIPIAGQTAEITIEDVEIIFEDIPGWLVTNNGKWTVALDITITNQLKKEGIARELVNRIQNIRKANGYEITDRINLIIQSDIRINEAVEENKQYIANQTLANNIILDNLTEGVELDLGDFKLLVNVIKE